MTQRTYRQGKPSSYTAARGSVRSVDSYAFGRGPESKLGHLFLQGAGIRLSSKINNNIATDMHLEPAFENLT